MTTKNILLTTTMSLVALLSIASVSNFDVFAEETEKQYKMSDDISATVEFVFRDGTETHHFPVFSTTTDFISNSGTTFNVQGVVDEAPLLHKALDQYYQYQFSSTDGVNHYEYPFRTFDVNVQIANKSETIRDINYNDCEVDDFHVKTLSDDYESYGFYPDKVGFAIIDDIDFRCGGVASNDDVASTYTAGRTSSFEDFGQTPYKFAEDARAIVTLEFNGGTEIIEFPIFESLSGFAEADDNNPSFHVEGIVSSHSLLDQAINQARNVGGITTAIHDDFDARVEFTNNGNSVRGLDYSDCRVSSFFIETYFDKEEGYTGKRGFAIVEQIDFECSGISPQNPTYHKIQGDAPIWSSSKMISSYMENPYNMGTGPQAIVTFTFDDGQETVNFPEVEQIFSVSSGGSKSTLTRTNPTLELTAVPNEYPLLYKHVDEAQKIGQNFVGSSSLTDFFDVDVTLVYGENNVRTFNYSDCRSTDYTVKTQHDDEESFFKGFSLTNEFLLECKGYHPNSPVYDAMFETVTYANTLNTNDLRNTDSWGPGFTIQE